MVRVESLDLAERAKAFPLGGKVARSAPDEGEMSGSYPPHQSPAVTASPRGGSLAWSLPGRLPCWEDCTGGIYAAPTNQPVGFSFPFGRGRGIPRRGNGQPPQIFPSSVTCGDSFPQRGKPFLCRNKNKSADPRNLRGSAQSFLVRYSYLNLRLRAASDFFLRLTEGFS